MNTIDQIRSIRNIARSIGTKHIETTAEEFAKRMFFNGQIEGIQIAVNCLTYADNPQDAALWSAFEKELIEMMKG